MLKIYDPKTASETILKRTPLQLQFARFGDELIPPEAVAQILQSIREEGDAALQRWTLLYDKVELDDFRIPPDAIRSAAEGLDSELIASLTRAAERIRAFHEKQPIPAWESDTPGERVGQRITPLDSVGIYVPGGTAPLPSSLLMSVIPARIAGVPEIVVCTPPNPHPVILAAAAICGVDRVYQLGGAQAIGALAFGTESVPRVDKIVGAGNLYVTLAKQQVYGIVGLDGLAGPTETLVIADESADPTRVAADLLAQAEHDVLASAILLTPASGLAEAVQVAAAAQLENLSRAGIIQQSLEKMGGIVLTQNLAEAVALANAYAPEHLCLMTAKPESLLPQLRHAGGIFIGEHAFEVLGDYVAGPSHIMPTGGTARFASPLSVLDFVKITSLLQLDRTRSAALSRLAIPIAKAESLTAHAAAAALRANNNGMEIGMSAAGSFQPERIVRRHIAGAAAYQPILPYEVLSEMLGRPEQDIVKLDANENPYGPPKAILDEIVNLHIYPDPESRALRAQLADFHGISHENILAGAGADELIDLLMRVCLDPGDRILVCPPTFGMYAFDAGIQAAEVIGVSRRKDFSLDLDAIEAAVGRTSPKLLFLANPNNPDGGLIPAETLEQLLALPLLVVLDEAYIEFSSPGESRLHEVVQRENLVVLRTFSKWAGLAGLRIGYGVFPDWLIRHLWKAKQPYNVSAAAQQAASRALAELDWLADTRLRIVRERERLAAKLSEFGWLAPHPSAANFILCRVQGLPGAEVKAALARARILVRFFDQTGLQDHIRISVGKPVDTDRLVRALSEMDVKQGV